MKFVMCDCLINNSQGLASKSLDNFIFLLGVSSVSVWKSDVLDGYVELCWQAAHWNPLMLNDVRSYKQTIP